MKKYWSWKIKDSSTQLDLDKIKENKRCYNVIYIIFSKPIYKPIMFHYEYIFDIFY